MKVIEKAFVSQASMSSRTMPDVKEDPKLKPEEKEVIIRFSKSKERMTVHGEQSSVVRWLHEHPEYQAEETGAGGGTLHATTRTLPIGCLKLSGSSRKSNGVGQVTGVL